MKPAEKCSNLAVVVILNELARGATNQTLCARMAVVAAILANTAYSSGFEKCRYIVRGGTPSMRAALSLFPSHRSTVACTNRFVASFSVVPMGMGMDDSSRKAAALFAAPDAVGANAKSLIVSPMARATARCMTCSSSRTLPGQVCARNWSSAFGVIAEQFRPSSPAKVRKEMLGEEWYVLAPLAQRRQHDLHRVDPIVQIMPEFSFRDGLGNVGMGGAEHAHVDVNLLRCAKALKAPVLQHAEQFGLQLGRHFRDFIQQQSSTVGQFEFAGSGRCRASESTAFVAKEFALKQSFGNCRATNFYERMGATIAQVVQSIGGDLLAGAAFALNEHVDIRGRDLPDELFDRLHLGAVANERVDAPPLLKLVAQAAVLAHQPLFFQCLGHCLEQCRAVQRFFNEIIRPKPHRLDRLFDAAVARYHHHFGFRQELARLLEQGEAVHVRQTQITDHEFHASLLQNLQRLLSGGSASDQSSAVSMMPRKEPFTVYLKQNQ